MKVEFLSDDLNGLELVIKGDEFLKATFRFSNRSFL